MKIYKYLIHCNDCNHDFTPWIPETDSIVCPVNSEHTVDVDNLEILQSRELGEVRDEHNKLEVIAESKPPGYVTTFTCIGDNGDIANGQDLYWDFSNTENDISCSVSGMKMKRIKSHFIDYVYIKEGALYFHDTLKGSYAILRIICPTGQYYYDHNKIPTLATEPVTVYNYVPKHFMAGSVPMGDELNTESCARDLTPPNYEMWIDVYVPDTDTSSFGWVSLELYRTRTCLLPGETV